MKPHRAYTAPALGLFLALAARLMAQNDYSIELVFRDYVPEFQGLIAKRTGDLVRVNQAALWRRDFNSFPGICDGVGASFLWNRGKLSYGGGVDVFNQFYAVDADRATNLPALSDTSFNARLMTWDLHAKVLLHLKGEHVSSVFVGAKAGVLLTGGGVTEWFTSHLSVSPGGSSNLARVPTLDFSPGLSLSVLAGLRLYLLEKPIRPYAAGMRFTVEYLFATDTLPFRMVTWRGGKVTGTLSQPTLSFNAGGLMVSVAFFLTFPGRVQKNP